MLPNWTKIFTQHSALIIRSKKPIINRDSRACRNWRFKFSLSFQSGLDCDHRRLSWNSESISAIPNSWTYRSRCASKNKVFTVPYYGKPLAVRRPRILKLWREAAEIAARVKWTVWEVFSLSTCDCAWQTSDCYQASNNIAEIGQVLCKPSPKTQFSSSESNSCRQRDWFGSGQIVEKLTTLFIRRGLKHLY